MNYTTAQFGTIEPGGAEKIASSKGIRRWACLDPNQGLFLIREVRVFLSRSARRIIRLFTVFPVLSALSFFAPFGSVLAWLLHIICLP